MQLADVTVVIPAYNAARFIGEAIESVLYQSVRPACVVVVDDGSTDDTLSVIQRFSDAVRVIAQRNTGLPGVVRNVGAAAATTEWLAFLDADDAWLPSKIERQIAAARSSHRAALIHTDRLNIGDRGLVPELQSDVQPLFDGDVFDRLLVACTNDL